MNGVRVLMAVSSEYTPSVCLLWQDENARREHRGVVLSTDLRSVARRVDFLRVLDMLS